MTDDVESRERLQAWGVGKPALPTWTVLACLATVLLVGGCGGSNEGTSTGGGGGTAGRSASDCNDLLETALAALQPEQYEVGDTDGVLTLLDDWRFNCGDSEETRAQGEALLGPETRRILTESMLERAASEAYQRQDAEHVRATLLLRSSADAAVGSAEVGTDDVVRLFHFVVQNVQLLDDDDPLAGVGVFRSLLFGQGSARDRAWVFAALLRQLRIDAVVIEPVAGEASDESRGSLVGVLVDGSCFLFDTRLGWPIPGPADDETTPLVERPATLAEVRGEADVLGVLDLPDAPYAFDDADLDEIRVLAVGNSSLFAPRMAGVQAVLTGERACVLVDSFDDTKFGEGLLTRLTRDHDQWTAADIGVWGYPETCMQESSADANASRRSALNARNDSFTIPLGEAGRLLLRARLQQLRGDLSPTRDSDGAAANFTRVLDSGLHTSFVHQDAARDALFWSAICALESGDRLSAEGGLRKYLEKYRNERFAPTSRFLLALGRAKRGGWGRAVEELDLISDDDPGRAGIALLRERWVAAGANE